MFRVSNFIEATLTVWNARHYEGACCSYVHYIVELDWIVDTLIVEQYIVSLRHNIAYAIAKIG